MAYEKTEWKARKGTDLNRHEKEQETARSVILHNVPTQVTEPGTKFSVHNMNKIEQGIYDAHEDLAAEVEERTRNVNTINEILNDLIGLPVWNDGEHIIVFTARSGATLEIDLPLEELVQDIDYDPTTKEIVLFKKDGTERRIPVSDLIDVYTGSVGEHIQIEIDSGNVIRARLLAGTVGEAALTAALLAKINGKLDAAEQAVDSAKLGGQLPAYYAKQADMIAADQNLQNQINVLDPESMIDELAKLAPINSPTFTGTPKVPAKSSAATSDGTLIATEAQVALKANITSPAFTGTPTAPEITTIPQVKNANTETLNDWGDQIVSMNTLRNAIIKNVWPTGAYYVQFPITGQSTYENMFPEDESPATLFGGTWTAQYEDEDVYFRTGSTINTTSNDRRGRRWNNGWQEGTTGIEDEAQRRVTGNIGRIRNTTAGDITSPFIRSATIESTFGSSGYAFALTSYDNALSVPTTNERGRVRNRLIKVWKKTA